MPSTYTVNLGIEKPATGEQSGTWGDTTNVNFDIIDQAVNGSVRVTLTSAGTSGSPNDLNIVNGSTTSSEGRNKWIEIYSASDLGGSAYVRLVPNDAEKILFIRNSLAGSQSVLLFQGTYNASNDLEIPAGVDMVVKFDGAGASATVTDVFTKLRATEITTPTLTAGTADINGGSIDGATVGAASASTGAFTTLTASTSLNIASSTTVDGVLDEDNMASDSATKLATQQSIKAYVDSQVGTVDTLAEILANGNTSGANNLIIDSGQALTANTINETTAGTGVTIDSVLLKDDVVNATDIETSNISANDGTAAATIANSTGLFTISSFASSSVNIDGGSIDGTNIGASSAGTGAFTTLTASGNVTVDTTTLVVDATNNTVNIGASVSNVALLNILGEVNGNILRMGSGGGNYESLDFSGTTDYGNGTIAISPTIVPGSGIGNTYTYFARNPGSGGGSTNHNVVIDNSFTVNDGGAVFNQDGNDNDFRVESDTNTHMLFVDAGNNSVAINASNPAADEFRVATTANFVTSTGTDPVYITRTSGYDQALKLYTDDTNSYIDVIQDEADISYGGLFFRSTNGINSNRKLLYLNQQNAVFNDDGADIDFRVESDSNTHMLFVDAGNDRVGINDSTPSEAFSVRGSMVQKNATTTNQVKETHLWETTNSFGTGLTITITFSAGTSRGFIGNWRIFARNSGAGVSSISQVNFDWQCSQNSSNSINYRVGPITMLCDSRFSTEPTFASSTNTITITLPSSSGSGTDYYTVEFDGLVYAFGTVTVA